MDYRNFSIRINSIHFPPIPEDSETWDKMDPDSRSLLSSLYNWLQSRMKTAAKPTYVAGRLGGSIFTCCLSDGLAMLLCRADAERRNTEVYGFFIHKNDGLRTAWQLARVPLMFVCAGGWCEVGTVSMTPEEINKRASSLMFPQDYQNRLVGMGIELLNSEIPFSFAFTTYPVHTAPLKFTSAHNQSEAVQSDSSAIVINPETLRACRAQTAKRFPGIQSFRLIRSTKKQFLEAKLDELAEYGSVKSEKAILKDILSRYPSDDVWYFKLIMREGEFSELLDQYTNNKLCAGAIPFEELLFAVKRAAADAKNFFLQQEDDRRQLNEEQKNRELRKSVPKLPNNEENPRRKNAGSENPFSRLLKK